MIGGTGPTGIPLVEGLVERGHNGRDPAPRPARTRRDARLGRARARRPVRRSGAAQRVGRSHLRRGLRDVRPAARRRRGAAGPGGPVRVGRRGSRVPRLHESVAPRAERIAGAHRRGRAHRAGARGGREGLPHRAHRGDGLLDPSRRRALPLPVRVRAVPARAAGVARGAAGARRPAPDRGRRRRASRCTITATPRTSRTRSCSRSSSPTPRPGRSSTSATRRCSASARSWRSSPPRSVTSSRSSRCPTTSPCPARPLQAQPLPTHRVLDLTRLRGDLGYRDLVPAREALARTAHWLVAHPLERGAQEERVLTDPFDYEAEDRLIDAWHAARASLPSIAFDAGARGTAWRTAAPVGDRVRQPTSTRERPCARLRSRSRSFKSRRYDVHAEPVPL